MDDTSPVPYGWTYTGPVPYGWTILVMYLLDGRYWSCTLWMDDIGPVTYGWTILVLYLIDGRYWSCTLWIDDTERCKSLQTSIFTDIFKLNFS